MTEKRCMCHSAHARNIESMLFLGKQGLPTKLILQNEGQLL